MNRQKNIIKGRKNDFSVADPTIPFFEINKHTNNYVDELKKLGPDKFTQEIKHKKF